MLLQERQQLTMIPALDQGEGIQLHSAACKLLQQLIRRRAGLDQVLARLHGIRLLLPARVPAQQSAVTCNSAFFQAAADLCEVCARWNIEELTTFGDIERRRHESLHMHRRNRRKQQQQGRKHRRNLDNALQVTGNPQATQV